MSKKLVNDFLDAIGILTDNAIAKSGAMVMIEATIKEEKSKDNQYYIITVAGEDRSAIGSDGYKKGDIVYISDTNIAGQYPVIQSLVTQATSEVEFYQKDVDAYDINSSILNTSLATPIKFSNKEDEIVVLYDGIDVKTILFYEEELIKSFNTDYALKVSLDLQYYFDTSRQGRTEDIDYGFNFIFDGGNKIFNITINDLLGNPFNSGGEKGSREEKIEKIFILNKAIDEQVSVLTRVDFYAKGLVGEEDFVILNNFSVYSAIPANNTEVGYSTHVLANKWKFENKDVISAEKYDLLAEEDKPYFTQILNEKYIEGIKLTAYMRKDGRKILDADGDATNVYYKWFLEDHDNIFYPLSGAEPLPSFEEGWYTAGEEYTEITNTTAILQAKAADNYCFLTGFKQNLFAAGTYLLKAKSTAKGQILICQAQTESSDLGHTPQYTVLAQSNSEINPSVFFTCSEDIILAIRIDNDAYDASLTTQIKNKFTDFELIKLDEEERRINIDQIFLSEKKVKCKSYLAKKNGGFLGEAETVKTLYNTIKDTTYSFVIRNEAMPEGAHLRLLTMYNDTGKSLSENISYSWTQKGNEVFASTEKSIIIDASKINGVDTYYCSATLNGLYCGQSEAIVTMIPKESNQRILIEGAKTYLYNGNNELFGSEKLNPLTVYFYNQNGEVMVQSQITSGQKTFNNFDIIWLLPGEKLDNDGNIVAIQDFELNNTVIIETSQTNREASQLYFGLKKYNLNASHNVIKVIITENDLVTGEPIESYTASVEIGIMRNGEPGTNGTRYICAISPIELKGDNESEATFKLLKGAETFPEFIQAFSGSSIKLSCSLIDTASYNNIVSENDSIQWYEKTDSGGWKSLNRSEREIVYNISKPAIIKVDIQQKNSIDHYYGYFTIAIRTDSNIYLDPVSGYSWVLYSSTFQRQNYRTNPFVLINNGVSAIYEQQEEPPLVFPKNFKVLEFKVEGVVKIKLPILYLVNRYEYAAINGWDGDNIVLDEENKTVLAPMAGFGKKESGRFTGAILGEVQQGNNVEQGIFGYNGGLRTFELNAANGSAKFGFKGGQIQLNPGADAIIQGGNYDEEKKKGMQINLTKPEISWGNEKFKVDENGNLTCKSGQIGSFYLDTSLSSSKGGLLGGNGVYLGTDGISVRSDDNNCILYSNGKIAVSGGGSTIGALTLGKKGAIEITKEKEAGYARFFVATKGRSTYASNYLSGAFLGKRSTDYNDIEEAVLTLESDVITKATDGSELLAYEGLHMNPYSIQYWVNNSFVSGIFFYRNGSIKLQNQTKSVIILESWSS